MNKVIISDLESFYEGIQEAVSVIASTYGYYGHTVLINAQGQPLTTKDGAFVSNHLGVKDPTKALASRLVKDGSLATYSKAGDGTTTCAVLIGAMVKDGLAAIAKGVNPFDHIEALKGRAQRVIGRLEVIPIESEAQLIEVATVSANNDVRMGEIVGQMAYKLGVHGTAQFEEGLDKETSVSIIDGYFFDGVPFDADLNQRLEFGQTKVFLCCDKLDLAEDLKRMWEAYYTEKEATSGRLQNLIIVCPDVTGNVLGNIRASQIAIQQKGSPINIVVVKAPSAGHMEDISFLVGAPVWGLRYGRSFKDITRENAFGSIPRARVDGMGTVFYHDKREEVEKYLETLDTEDETRIAKLVSGVGFIRVGGSTSVERNNRRLQLDDAYKTCFAALNDGIVIGGGYALHQAADGDAIFSEPLKQLMVNAFDTPAEIDKLIRYFDDTKKVYDLKKGEYTTIEDSKIYDPVRATIAAVENAVSVASQVLSIKYIINEE